MSLPTWIPAALSSEARPERARCWRAVESQYASASMALVDDLAEQEVLEGILEETKPSIPPECEGLHYLLFSPFRYSARRDSRFHTARERKGVFYASLKEETALAEVTFWRLLAFAESPATPWPANPVEFTLFHVRIAAERAIDLTRPPFDREAPLWSDPVDYAPCQRLAQEARRHDVDLIRYRSVRDPKKGDNLALLRCRVFAARKPGGMHNWHLRFSAHGVMAISQHGRKRLQFSRESFANDLRIAALNWER